MNILVYLSFLLLPMSSVDPVEVTSTYCNARFGFCVEYPADIFTETENPTNADGILLTTPNQDVSMALYGEYNVFNYTINEQHQFMLEAMAKSEGPILDHVTVFGQDRYDSTLKFANHTVEVRCEKSGAYFINAILGIKEGSAIGNQRENITVKIDSK